MNFKQFRTQVPTEYQELTFIANSGAQYIDTGLKGSDLADCEVEIVMRNDATSLNMYNFNGSYLSGSTAQFGLVATSDSECRSSINFGFADAVSTTGLNISEFHTLYATNGLQKVDNTVVGTFNFGTMNDGNFLLFARTDPSQTSGINICKAMSLKSFTVKRNNKYIRNMIPAKRKSDNIFGLYDTVNGVFYTNQGAYNFTGGTVVEPTWHDTPHYIHTTSTDTITTLPAVLYPNAVTATVGLKGQMEQSGAPSPTTPIQPSECGDLETVGEKAGQYKIPILSGGVTTPVYLGEVESTRRIKKLVFNGTENWQKATNFLYLSGLSRSATSDCICSHYKGTTSGANYTCTMVGNMLRVYDRSYSTAEDFKTYLAAQYANGTPVTIWYVLAEPTTGIVNEPLRKIGDYADTASGITIPTITGKDTFDVLTTLKPSEVTVNYHGWHTGAVHERENGAWT